MLLFLFLQATSEKTHHLLLLVSLLCSLAVTLSYIFCKRLNLPETSLPAGDGGAKDDIPVDVLMSSFLRRGDMECALAGSFAAADGGGGGRDEIDDLITLSTFSLPSQ